VADHITEAVSGVISVADHVAESVAHPVVVVVMVMGVVVPGVFVSADVVEQLLEESDELALVHPLERSRTRAAAVRGGALLHLGAGVARAAGDSAFTVRPRRWRGCAPEPHSQRGDDREVPE
jgi:hypothetical protein